MRRQSIARHREVAIAAFPFTEGPSDAGPIPATTPLRKEPRIRANTTHLQGGTLSPQSWTANAVRSQRHLVVTRRLYGPQVAAARPLGLPISVRASCRPCSAPVAACGCADAPNVGAGAKTWGDRMQLPAELEGVEFDGAVEQKSSGSPPTDIACISRLFLRHARTVLDARERKREMLPSEPEQSNS